MKRIKVTAKKGCVKDITIFHGSDVLAAWLKHGKRRLSANAAYTSVLMIEGDMLDVEWLGLESMSINGNYVCLDFVKVVNESIDENDVSRTVYGWITGDILSFANYETGEFSVRLLEPDEPPVDDDIDNLLNNIDDELKKGDVD
jgi:hypothetical protein